MGSFLEYGTNQALGALIQQQRQEIERRWIVKVRTEAGTVTHLPALLQTMPDYLEALGAMLSGDSHPPGDQSRLWTRLSRQHGATRVRHGFDISEIIRELVLLREVLFDIAREQGLVADRLFEEIVAAVDIPIATSVLSYIDARNYETRRTEAEHISFATHELRNPLSTATMAAGMLREMEFPSHEGARAVELLQRSLTKLRELIDSVLEAEQLEAGEVEYQPVNALIGPLIDECMQNAREEARAKGLTLQVSCDPTLLFWIDPKLTSSAVQNLADNAVKFTDIGQVTVRAEEGPAGLIVHVWDACEGLSAEELRIIFEPFRRGAHRNKPGSGLGLSIARRAVEAQGGTIQAESRDLGCHFWITLPRVHH